MRLIALVLFTNHIEALRAFFVALGIVPQHEKHGDGPDHYSITCSDGTVIELYPSKFVSLHKRELRMSIEIEDFDATVEKLTALGINVPQGKVLGGRRITTVTDPEGRRVELVEAR